MCGVFCWWLLVGVADFWFLLLAASLVSVAGVWFLLLVGVVWCRWSWCDVFVAVRFVGLCFWWLLVGVAGVCSLMLAASLVSVAGVWFLLLASSLASVAGVCFLLLVSVGCSCWCGSTWWPHGTTWGPMGPMGRPLRPFGAPMGPFGTPLGYT